VGFAAIRANRTKYAISLSKRTANPYQRVLCSKDSIYNLYYLLIIFAQN